MKNNAVKTILILLAYAFIVGVSALVAAAATPVNENFAAAEILRRHTNSDRLPERGSGNIPVTANHTF